jgi:hypothetical protein
MWMHSHAACLQRLVDRRPREGGVGAERDALSLGLLAADLGQEQFLQSSALETLPDRSFAARQSPWSLNVVETARGLNGAIRRSQPIAGYRRTQTAFVTENRVLTEQRDFLRLSGSASQQAISGGGKGLLLNHLSQLPNK